MLKSLGYIGCESAHADDWNDLLINQIGLMRNDTLPNARAAHYRIDGAESRLTILPGATERLLYLGWDAGSKNDFERTITHLKATGLSIGDGEAGLASERRVADVAVFTGPDGVRHELFHQQKHAATSFASPFAKKGFKTGEEGLGHAVLASENRQQAAQWYQDILGFKLSDEIMWDDAEATFMHCNPRHHSLAVLNCCMGMQPGQLNHIMLEFNSLEDVGRAYDRVRAAGTPLALQIGQHINDKVVSFYLITPSGSAIELGYGGISVDDETWQPTTYSTPKIWGHDPGEGPAVV